MLRAIKRPVIGLLALVLCAGLAGVGWSATNRNDLEVTQVRVFTDGNVHISFSAPISSACGSTLRANGEGSENVVRVATAAMLSGKRVDVQSEDAKSGAFCNLVYLRLVQ